MNQHSSPRLLIMLPNPLGDTVLATPALTALRQALPQAQWTLLGNAASLAILADNPYNAAAITLPPDYKKITAALTLAKQLRQHHFDAAIIFPNSFRTALLTKWAKIPIRLGFRRDGRALLLTHPVMPIRFAGRFLPISMIDTYRHLISHAVHVLAPNASSPIPDNRRLSLTASAQDKHQAQALFHQHHLDPTRPLVVMVPGGAFGGSKFWPVDRFASLASQLIEQRNAQIIISCAPNDTERQIAAQLIQQIPHPVTNLLDDGINLGTLKAVIAASHLVISNDTGPCHIAAAFNVPLLTFFGPTDPRWTATGYEQEIRLHGQAACRPCQQGRCQRDHACMHSIPVDQAYQAAISLLDRQLNGDIPLALQLQSQPFYHPWQESFDYTRHSPGLVHWHYQQLLHKHNLDSVDGVFAYTQGQSLHKPGLKRRERFRLQLSDDQQNTHTLYLKRYQPGKLPRSCPLSADIHNDAVADFYHAILLAEQDIPSFRPIAIGWDHTGRSYVIIEELPHAEALERLLPRCPQAQHDYPLLNDRLRLITELAQLVRRLHSRNLFHRDLYLSHIFLAQDDQKNQRLCLIDLQRVFTPRFRRRRWVIKDLAQLYYSAHSFFSMPEMMRFLHIYLNTTRLTPADKALVTAILRKARRIARHDRHRQLYQR